MPTKREREYYAMGFRDGVAESRDTDYEGPLYPPLTPSRSNRPSKSRMISDLETGFGSFTPPKRRRKLSKWQKFVKDNAKKPRFRYKSGAKKGKINLKALGVAYRKKKR